MDDNTFELTLDEISALEDLTEDVNRFLKEMNSADVDLLKILNRVKPGVISGAFVAAIEAINEFIQNMGDKWGDILDSLWYYEVKDYELDLDEIQQLKFLPKTLERDEAAFATLWGNTNLAENREIIELFREINMKYAALSELFFLFLKEVTNDVVLWHCCCSTFLRYTDLEVLVRILDCPGAWLRVFMIEISPVLKPQLAPDNRWSIADKYARENPGITIKKYKKVLDRGPHPHRAPYYAEFY